MESIKEILQGMDYLDAAETAELFSRMAERYSALHEEELVTSFDCGKIAEHLNAAASIISGRTGN